MFQELKYVPSIRFYTSFLKGSGEFLHAERRKNINFYVNRRTFFDFSLLTYRIDSLTSCIALTHQQTYQLAN